MSMAASAAMAIGSRIDRKDTTVDVMSSAMLTGTFPAPPVVAVTSGRTAADFARCTLPATSRPQAIARTGLMP